MIMQRSFESFSGLKSQDWSQVLEFINESFEKIEVEKEDCLDRLAQSNVPTELKTSIMTQVEAYYRSTTESLYRFAHGAENHLGINDPT